MVQYLFVGFCRLGSIFNLFGLQLSAILIYIEEFMDRTMKDIPIQFLFRDVSISNLICRFQSIYPFVCSYWSVGLTIYQVICLPIYVTIKVSIFFSLVINLSIYILFISLSIYIIIYMHLSINGYVGGQSDSKISIVTP